MQPMQQFWGAGLRYWRTSSGTQRALFVGGTALLLSMLFHGVVLLLSGGPLNGPVSFRKAITFAESLGLLCWSFAWMLPFFRLGRWRERLAGGFVLGFALGEAVIFAAQVWRGVPSHYNFSSDLDALLFLATGVGAGSFTLLCLLLLPLTGRIRVPSYRLAIRAGLLLYMFGAAVGVLMIFNSGGVWQGVSEMRLAFENSDGRYTGKPENAVGGSLVLLHALGVHGLQIVPLAAWLLGYSALSERARLALTGAVASLSLALFCAFAAPVFAALPLRAFAPLHVAAIAIIGFALLACYGIVAYQAWRGLLSPGNETVQPIPGYDTPVV